MAANGDSVLQMTQPGPPGQIEDANGLKISVGLTAQQIFDDQDATGKPTAANVFGAVTGLLTALQNNDGPGILTAVTNIQTASAHLNDESSFYGAAQNNLTAAGNSASQTLIEVQQQLSNEQDADAAQASLDLTTANTDLQAAMASQAMLKPQSLFNYLG